jgi:hypothetical protein
LAVVAHGAEKASHLRKRCTAGPLDACERVFIVLLRLRKLVPDRADLEHHDADGVGDDVVELARYARALLGNGDAGG